MGDHLGSTSITTNASGVFTSELRYRTFGDTRYTSGGIPTRYRFTGQRSYTPDFGLYYYGSRWYDPALGRFIQPDTIVPDSSNPQDLNRYSYVRNSPLKHIDPIGHVMTLTRLEAASLPGRWGDVLWRSSYACEAQRGWL
jgi:RHS repeat-associated protein